MCVQRGKINKFIYHQHSISLQSMMHFHVLYHECCEASLCLFERIAGTYHLQWSTGSACLPRSIPYTSVCNKYVCWWTHTVPALLRKECCVMYVSQRRERSHVSVLSRSFCSLSLSFPLSLSLTHTRPVGVRLSHFWWTRLYTRLIACRETDA